MASILDKYGIKEVADVTFYELDDLGKPEKPVLYLDTLKVSTIEQTAEQAEARGGKGNAPLIIWDYGKEITVTLEDALFSAKSLAIMFGNGAIGDKVDGGDTILKTIQFTGSVTPTQWQDPEGNTHEITSPTIYDATGAVSTKQVEGETYFATFAVKAENLGVVEISASNFPGTYYITGDTFARKETNGKDEFFQFIIPKAKVQSENTITLEAEGDPSVFNMSLRVMRPSDGQMMKLVKYTVENNVG